MSNNDDLKKFQHSMKRLIEEGIQANDEFCHYMGVGRSPMQIKAHKLKIGCQVKIPSICVDVDGVLAQTGMRGLLNIGAPLPGAKEFITDLCKISKVIIYTTRCNEKANNKSAAFLESLIRLWLESNELPFDSIHTGQGKPVALAYIDDKAILCQPLQHEGSNGTYKVYYDTVFERVKYIMRPGGL